MNTTSKIATALCIVFGSCQDLSGIKKQIQNEKDSQLYYKRRIDSMDKVFDRNIVIIDSLIEDTKRKIK